ncbi:hypothetical protein FUAX_21320 [Fulvitalea axinellae]|uniref:Uncharacterized protein n=1 Tax=Fulvitalea axinellae TaxID=1182444 RepID=A0AAU9DFF6_9BACT|nr:hypothetical protein FUAX_21320 [Fulvitalea axinellae]
MTFQEYQKLREQADVLLEKIFDYNQSNMNRDMKFVAKRLGIWSDGAIVAESEEDGEVIMDYILHEKNPDGKRLVDDFYDYGPELDDSLEEIALSHTEAFASVFLVDSVNPKSKTVVVEDQLDGELTRYEIMNEALANSATPETPVFLRLVPFKGMNVTTGVPIMFSEYSYGEFKKGLSLLRMKKRGNVSPEDLFVLAFKRGDVGTTEG